MEAEKKLIMMWVHLLPLYAFKNHLCPITTTEIGPFRQASAVRN
jgi:hypothetical protein